MKKIVSILVLVLLVFACKTDEKTKEIQTAAAIETPEITLGEFDSRASEFVNKEVKVKGIVDHICKHGGKKIFLVTDEGDLHLTAEERFDEKLNGSEISAVGIVLEERIDESYCLKMEEDNIKSHSEGASNKEQFEAKKKHIQQYRDQMKAENKAYISNFSLKYVSHTVIE